MAVMGECLGGDRGKIGHLVSNESDGLKTQA